MIVKLQSSLIKFPFEGACKPAPLGGVKSISTLVVNLVWKLKICKVENIGKKQGLHWLRSLIKSKDVGNKEHRTSHVKGEQSFVVSRCFEGEIFQLLCCPLFEVYENFLLLSHRILGAV